MNEPSPATTTKNFRRRSWSELYVSSVILLLLLLALQAIGQENTTNNPPSRVARISYLQGDVSFLRAGINQWSQASLNFPATTGDRIYAGKHARAELEVGPYVARIWERTDLTVTNLNDQIMQLGLAEGSLRVTIRELASGNTVEVDTPNGALTLQRQGKYRVDVDRKGDQTTVSVIDGELEVTGGGVSQAVNAGQAVRLTGRESIQVESIPMPPPDAFDAWCEERDLRLTSSKSADYINPDTPGFEDLDEYGHWTEIEEYGPVWFPPVAVGWIPYRFGHWVWIDPWGWTWVEDEPWGFCQFHFGRWVLVGATWGWIPGPLLVPPVYAPAFVAFLGGPGFSFGVGVGLVGWFPLGPRDPFFPWYHYGGNYLNVINVTNIRNVTNVTNIINVTNINEVHYAYRDVATTAVPQRVFSSGQQVAKQMVHVSPQQLAKAQVIPHPAVNPTRQAAMAGKPVPAPPVRTQPRFATAQRATPTRTGAVASTRQGSPTRNQPPAENASRSSAPAGRTQPAIRSEPPDLVTRAAPPRPSVPFLKRLGSMAVHPGRPLEPAQVEHLREGVPVGPMVDREFPPHPFGIARGPRPRPRLR